MKLQLPTQTRLTLAVALIAGLVACSGSNGGSNSGDDGDSGSGSGSSGGTPSNIARFVYDCDLLGVNGELTITVEAVSTAGVVFGSGPNPDITGVIGTGSVSYLTAGELRSPSAFYVFTGRDDFADFVEINTSERFLVQWVINGRELNLIANPFGPGPTQHECVQRSADFI
jgi:hypothetical protein